MATDSRHRSLRMGGGAKGRRRTPDAPGLDSLPVDGHETNQRRSPVGLVVTQGRWGGWGQQQPRWAGCRERKLMPLGAPVVGRQGLMLMTE